MLLPRECRGTEDENPLTFHLGLFQANSLASVATFQPQYHQDLSGGFPFRLRWMATEEKHRRRGFGAQLLRQGIEVLREQKCDLLWFNARQKACEFYARIGFVYTGGPFEIPGVGPHKVMYKHLIPR